MPRTLALLFAAAFFSAAAHGQTTVASASPAGASLLEKRLAIDPKWESSFAAFDEADRSHAPAPGGVLFVGSSSIRLWNTLETQFSNLPVVVKRGFGGSRMEDCTRYLSRLVTPYQPRMVLVYAGENDLAEGRSPEQVAESFRHFVEGVREALPETRIAYISIKPSVLRKGLLEQIKATNSLIHDYVADLDNAAYIDVFTPMLSQSGGPRPELFGPDMLHMNATGYALWKSVIDPYVVAPERLRQTAALTQ